MNPASMQYRIHAELDIDVECFGTFSCQEKKSGYEVWLMYNPDAVSRAGIRFPTFNARRQNDATICTWFVKDSDLNTFTADSALAVSPITTGDYFHLAYDDDAFPDFQTTATTTGNPICTKVHIAAGSRRVVFHPLSRQLTVVKSALPLTRKPISKPPSWEDVALHCLLVLAAILLFSDMGIF